MNTEWDLSFLYKSFDDPQIAADMETMKSAPDTIAKILASGKAPAVVMEEAVEAMNRFEDTISTLYAYVFLNLSTDSANKSALALTDPLGKISLGYRKSYNSIVRYAAGLDMDAVIAENPALEKYAFGLREMKDEAKHLLPEAVEEPIMKMRLTGGNAFNRLYSQLVASVSIHMDGHDEPLSLAAVRGMAYSPDAAVRKAAYEAELAAYSSVEIGVAACLNAVKGEALTLLDYNGYETVLDRVLANSRIDREILDAMISAMQDSLPDFRRYLKAKARLLGHENGLPFYELFAPVGNSTRTFTYDEARDYLVRVMGRFSQKMADFIDHAFENRWIDAMPHVGKEGGAFCEGLYPQKQSRIMTNFDGSFSSVSTLAHELGHAYHNLNLQNEPAFNRSVPMQLAETASTFNETLLSRAALAEADDEEAFALIEASLMDSTQVIVDILSRFLFESRMIEIRKERTLTSDELCEIMIGAQKDTYGDGLDPEYMHPYMWLCKSHYYGSDFYNFPYAFGLLFGLGVYHRYTEDPEAFLGRYDDMLRSCGKDSAANVAAGMGIDIRSKAFWASGLAEIRGQIDRFCEMVSTRV